MLILSTQTKSFKDEPEWWRQFVYRNFASIEAIIFISGVRSINHRCVRSNVTESKRMCLLYQAFIHPITTLVNIITFKTCATNTTWLPSGNNLRKCAANSTDYRRSRNSSVTFHVIGKFQWIYKPSDEAAKAFCYCCREWLWCSAISRWYEKQYYY